jgi:hypothetical protein
MRHILIALLSLSGFSCGGSEKLFKAKTKDGGEMTARRGFFSGIDYLFFEKRINKRVAYSITYDCECKSRMKISLIKRFSTTDGQGSSWLSVTDTTSGLKLFGDSIDTKRVKYPVEFIPISSEEVLLIQQAINTSSKECCNLPSKPISNVIGYIKLRRTGSHIQPMN